MMKKIRPPIKTHGGKFYLVDFIVSHFPKDYTKLKYIEGCCGGCSVLLNKERSIVEIANDADPSIAAIIQELVVEDPSEFINDIQRIEYDKKTFEWSKAVEEIDALAELVRRRFSRGGLRQAFAWSNRLRGGQPGDKNAWDTFKKYEIARISERLKGVEVFCLPVSELVERFDAEDVFIYCDPPYLPTTRQSHKVYEVEMTEGDHVELAERLNAAKCKVILSGYQSSLYTKMYKSWNMFCRPIANHSSQSKSKQKRIEILWTNY